MKLEEMLDIFDIDEIEKMSPEECKGLLKGFFIGYGFIDMVIKNGYGANRKRSACEPYKPMKKDHTRQEFRNIQLEFENREDAEEIVNDLRTILETTIETGNKAYVQVRDLYSLADLPTSVEMFNWIWYNLDDCIIERSGDNYVLKMPPAEPRPDRA